MIQYIFSLHRGNSTEGVGDSLYEQDRHVFPRRARWRALRRWRRVHAVSRGRSRLTPGAGGRSVLVRSRFVLVHHVLERRHLRREPRKLRLQMRIILFHHSVVGPLRPVLRTQGDARIPLVAGALAVPGGRRPRAGLLFDVLEREEGARDVLVAEVGLMAQFEGQAVVLGGVLLGGLVAGAGEGGELVGRGRAPRARKVQNGAGRLVVRRVRVVRLGRGKSLLVRFRCPLRGRRGGRRRWWWRRRQRRREHRVAREFTPLRDAEDLVTRGQGGKHLVDADERLAAYAVLLLDGIELGLEDVVLLGEFDDALFEDHVVEATLFARALGGLVVAPTAVPVAVVLFAVGDEFTLFALPEELFTLLGEVKVVVGVIGPVYGAALVHGEVRGNGESRAGRRWCPGGRGRGAQWGAPGAQQLLLAQDELGDHVAADDGSARILTVVL